MKQGIELTIANPGARVLEHAGVVWVTAGLDAEGIEALRRRAPESAAGISARPATDGIEAALCRRYGDAAVIRIAERAGAPPALSAWRGLSAGYDVFHHRARDGTLTVSDHFRNILSAIPVAERAPAQHVLCDHFLFRTVPGSDTLCWTVQRLGRGQTFSAAGGNTSRPVRFDWVDAEARPDSVSGYVDRIDEALQSVLAAGQPAEDPAALFSGGVDSTLIQTYLGAATPAVCYELPWYAEGFEAGYAERAAKLLSVSLEKHTVRIDDCLGMLESAIDAAAMPPPHLQLVMYQTLFDLPYRTFVFGEQADALFGIELRRARLAVPFTSAAGRQTLALAAKLLPGRAHRLRRIREAADRLAVDSRSLDGYGARFGTYTDWPLLQDVFGETTVLERLQARLELADSMQNQVRPAGRFHQHVELAQMIDYLCEDVLACFRHLAHAYGRTMTSPFVTRTLLDAALGIPAEARYLKGLEGKYLLKRLLERRLPAYPVNQQKGYTHVPFAELYRDGPLSGIWRKYSVPEPFDRDQRAALTANPTQMTWNAITLAIWRRRVQQNPALAPIRGSRTFRWNNVGREKIQSEV